ncbi:hypothetical protein LTSEALA_3611 [Salmonella enterica subsp. enterica serovar Alachua str. R6-377]|uniref:Uncharacterized protein n=1 Tax=Salmonella enterica subsp. enterica serovar Alachua str. R6-377 TaxID=913241 RepID=G5LRQ4_SALET|nr:hypothetical protein LTSEALA_3611 [Salmonella enterica subsp. enterica serovar Alachua str. R6-377]
MGMEHEPQRRADKHSRKNAPAAKAARRRDDQRGEFDDG